MVEKYQLLEEEVNGPEVFFSAFFYAYFWFLSFFVV